MADVKVGSSSKLPYCLTLKGELHSEQQLKLILCKPKLMPLKSVTLKKLENMQKEADEKMRQQTALKSD